MKASAIAACCTGVRARHAMAVYEHRLDTGCHAYGVFIGCVVAYPNRIEQNHKGYPNGFDAKSFPFAEYNSHINQVIELSYV